MTREQKIEAFRMLTNGSTYREIGDHFNVSKQYIHQVLHHEISGRSSKPLTTIIYPNLKKWMLENDYTVLRLQKEIGFSSRNVASMYSKLRGERILPIGLARKILDITGMTFEKCFLLEEDTEEFIGRKQKGDD